MWISKRLALSRAERTAERGYVSMNYEGNVEAASTVNSRNTVCFSPYGYTYAVPVGEEVILVPSNDGQVLLGTKNESAGLEAGEIKISSAGGASITLKNDGRVIINGRVFLKKGR